MHLSEEEKKNQKAISDSVINNQPVENLADDDLREDEKIENSIPMGLRKDPLFVKPDTKEDNKKNEQNEEQTMGTMGTCCEPPETGSPIKKFFRKLFGK